MTARSGSLTRWRRPLTRRGALLAVALASILSTAAPAEVPPVPASSLPSLVRTSGRQLLVRRRLTDGTLTAEAPFVIRGVVWSPASETTNTTPSDRNNANVRRPEFGTWFQQDVTLMATMHVNTVRFVIDPGVDATLGPIGLAVLDALHQHGIMAIMTVDDGINSAARIASAVSFYKHHPAILMWSIGSEWNINRYFGTYGSVQAAAAATETSAALIKQLDPHHPVATSYGDIDANLATFVTSTVPSVDVWSLNTYRGNTLDNAAGSVFDEWAAISGKPMFIGEFGVDAFHGRCLSNPPTGVVNEAQQAAWTLDLWNDIARNLSAVHPDYAALGGTVFAWNDEWWKVPPPGSQQTGGWTSDGFPDWHGTEEFFGIVDIRRAPRQVYAGLATAFDPAYVPPTHTTTFRAISRGANLCGAQADFRRDGWTFYQRAGGGSGGRGFNVAVADAGTGAIVDAGRNFDTWGGGATAKNALVTYLASIANGRLVLLAVADEAGLNPSPSLACHFNTDAATVALLAAIDALGSTRIRQYCWRGSWAMVTVKGSSVALAEDVQRTEEARAEAALPTPEPPTSAADQYATPTDTTLSVSAPGVLANDLTHGGGTLTAQLVSGPTRGVVSLDANGGFTYVPGAGLIGTDRFTYRAANVAGDGTVATVTLVVGPPQPAAPTNLRIRDIDRVTVTFTWSHNGSGPPATGFRIEGGAAPGEILGSLTLGPVPALTIALPPGSWYLRVRAIVNSDVSAPSNEVLVHATPSVAPPPPTNLLGLADGNGLHLAWTTTPDGVLAVGGPTASVRLDVTGSAVASVPLGPASTFSFAPVPPGTYTFSVVAQNAAGISAPSNAVTLTFPAPCSGPSQVPGDFVAFTSGAVVTALWDLPPGGPAPTGYRLNVIGSIAASLPITGRVLRSPAPPGTFTLTVQAVNPCGSSAPTPARAIVVP